MSEQYGRKASLIVSAGSSGLDLSQLRFTFQTSAQNEETPNNCRIRVYNLKSDTVKQVQKEFTRVVLQAGYEQSYGVIFDGTIKQFRVGRENGTDTYLDILAADGDQAYNFGVVNQTLASGSTPAQRRDALIKSMSKYGIQQGVDQMLPGGVLPRGKVLFGMPRVFLRGLAQSNGCTWGISNGKVNILAMDGYLPGEAVKLTSATGMVGVPEATIDGIKVRCLLNPRIVVGGLVHIDNTSINQTAASKQTNPANVAFDTYKGVQLFADVTNDGLYAVYVAEHEGDTRGHNWYTNLVCLAVDPVTQKVKPYGSS